MKLGEEHWSSGYIEGLETRLRLDWPWQIEMMRPGCSVFEKCTVLLPPVRAKHPASQSLPPWDLQEYGYIAGCIKTLVLDTWV